MFGTLLKCMENEKWSGLDKVKDYWNKDYKGRKIITEFMKDKTIGSKRLASMPDRVTNTINIAGGGQVFRPTLINQFEGDLDTIENWFKLWIKFMFDTTVKIKSKKGENETKKVCELLMPIKQSKYPAITKEEEAVSIPLQTLCQAIFDAILVYMLNTVAPKVWMPIKKKLCQKLNKGKINVP
eukprot:UN05139